MKFSANAKESVQKKYSIRTTAWLIKGISDKKVTCVKHNEPVKFRMEEYKTTLAGTFYCSTWNKAPGLRCGELH